jgi:hypothetical protein
MGTELVESKPLVQLTAGEIRRINELAEYRTSAKVNKEQVGIMGEDIPETSETDEEMRDAVKEIHTVGAVGEYAFAKFYDFPFPYSPEGEVDGGFDFIVEIPNGDWLTVDVKTTIHWNGNLILQSYKDVNADLYVLVNYDKEENHARLNGMVAGDVFAESPIKSGKYSIPSYEYKPDNLVNVFDPEDVEIVEPERYKEKVIA